MAGAGCMARRQRVFAEGLLYHVIVRGNSRRPLFRMAIITHMWNGWCGIG
jgi:REP element-mobilizing transposase RayT